MLRNFKSNMNYQLHAISKEELQRCFEQEKTCWNK